MKILFCSLTPLDLRLGAAKVIIELAAEMKKLGWQCDFASDEDICPGIGRLKPKDRTSAFRPKLKSFLQRRAGDFDVVDYDHLCLPYPRAEFDPETVFVSRSVLLAHHFEKIPLPPMPALRHRINAVVAGPLRRLELRREIEAGNLTCREADLVNVSNDDDKAELISRGIPGDKITVIPYGLTDARFTEFNATPPAPAASPTVAFVGTFDSRKGAAEFPAFVENLAKTFPDVKIRMLGARYKSENDVRRYFRAGLHRHLEIIPKFSPEELPRLLAPCWAGILPSYVEGFGFAVLELLAAGLPVFAYRAPGPTMILPDEYLVERGDAGALSRKVAGLLSSAERLSQARIQSRTLVERFKWSAFAEETSRIYKMLISSKLPAH